MIIIFKNLKKLKSWGLVASLLLSTACQNSVNLPNGGSQNLTSNEDLADSALHFSTTLWPLVNENCSECHSSISPLFAIPGSIEESHDALLLAELVDFDNIRGSRIIQRVRLGHNNWTNDPQADGDLLYDAIVTWNDLRGTSGGGPSGIITSAVTVPSDVSTPQVMSFSLEGLGAGVPDTATIEFQIEQLDSTTYLISDLKIKSTADLFVKEVKIYINNVRFSSPDWADVETTIPANPATGTLVTSSAIIPQTGYGLDDASEGGPGVDEIILGFNLLSEPLEPVDIAFGDMLSALEDAGCDSCHNGQIAAGQNEFGNFPVPAFMQFSSSDDFIFASTYGSNPDASPRFLVEVGDPTRSGLYRVIAHHTNGESFTEYEAGGVAENSTMNNAQAPANAAAAQELADLIAAWINLL